MPHNSLVFTLRSDFQRKKKAFRTIVTQADALFKMFTTGPDGEMELAALILVVNKDVSATTTVYLSLGIYHLEQQEIRTGLRGQVVKLWRWVTYFYL